MITIAIQSDNFEHRLCWMLSSLSEQTARNFIIDVAYLGNNPLMQATLDAFPALAIKRRPYLDDDRFRFRGLVRNDQLSDCCTSWLLFADTDHVYHAEYFERLAAELTNHRQYGGMLTAGRWSCPVDQANALVAEHDYPAPVHTPWAKARKLDLIRRSNVGAGYFQLINARVCDHGGYYVKRTRDGDWRGGGQKARSDMQFRRRIAIKMKLPRWFSRAQIHLNHVRDSDAGHHITEQR